MAPSLAMVVLNFTFVCEFLLFSGEWASSPFVGGEEEEEDEKKGKTSSHQRVAMKKKKGPGPGMGLSHVYIFITLFNASRVSTQNLAISGL